MSTARKRFIVNQETDVSTIHSNAYNIFIFVLAILALVILVATFFPLSVETKQLLWFYDNLICVIFLIDFFFNLRASSPKSYYFFKARGWLDLLGSIPALGHLSNYIRLLRLARLIRIARILHLMRKKDKVPLLKDVVENRSKYTFLITVLMSILVLTIASVLVLQFESQSPDANIQSGGDSLWFSIVTITTLGYGDSYPVTPGGRITAVFIMIMGVGIIGALASILSSLLVGSAPAPEVAEAADTTQAASFEYEMATLRNELAEMRQLLEKILNAGDQK
jgi:voltage-gated potassium channel